MRQNDRNGNGRLEENEWNDRWGRFRDADRNRDGAVRADEMARQLGEFSRGGMGPGRSRPEGQPGSDSSGSSGSDGSDKPKSYRLRLPTERLPEGLPPWFASKDANADGQVAMAEYEAPGYWTAAAAAAFRRWDLNNDGMITPGECLTVLQQPGKEGELAQTGAASQVARANGTGPYSPRRSERRSPAPAPGSSTPSTGASASGGVWEGFD